ncbi:MAG TPA: LLM class F420-dependent oxidoreductase [Candidatus Dormibacteraeota bacterium]|jgi:F420-dependent oxidoreductase-like protein
MPSFTFPGVPPEGLFDRVATLALAAEAAGFDAVTVMDHFYQIGGVGSEDQPMLEAYVTLGALAARTSRVRLATLVTGVTYRNPALLAKMATTLDVISGGRAIFGIGAAWNESEHTGYGFDFPPIGERMDRLDEALTIARAMFTQDRPTFEGKHYRIDRALNCPRPIQAGGPRILIGGGGERRTLRLVARHGDISHWWGTLDELKHKSEVLDRHCEAEGRDPSTILRTLGAPVVLVGDEREASAVLERVPPARRGMITPATVEQAAEILGKYVDAGFGGFTFNNPLMDTPEALSRAGELIGLLS